MWHAGGCSECWARERGRAEPVWPPGTVTEGEDIRGRLPRTPPVHPEQGHPRDSHWKAWELSPFLHPRPPKRIAKSSQLFFSPFLNSCIWWALGVLWLPTLPLPRSLEQGTFRCLHEWLVLCRRKTRHISTMGYVNGRWWVMLKSIYQASPERAMWEAGHLSV